MATEVSPSFGDEVVVGSGGRGSAHIKADHCVISRSGSTKRFCRSAANSAVSSFAASASSVEKGVPSRSGMGGSSKSCCDDNAAAAGLRCGVAERGDDEGVDEGGAGEAAVRSRETANVLTIGRGVGCESRESLSSEAEEKEATSWAVWASSMDAAARGTIEGIDPVSEFDALTIRVTIVVALSRILSSSSLSAV